MPLSALADRDREPERDDLERVLGSSVLFWDLLTLKISQQHAPVDAVWNFAGAKFGWSLRLKRRDRVVVYLIPQQDRLLAGIVLGEKAVRTSRSAALPIAMRAAIDDARAYAEGRGIRVEVKSAGDVDAILRLAALKMTKE